MSKYRYDKEIDNRREDVGIEFNHLMEAVDFYFDEVMNEDNKKLNITTNILREELIKLRNYFDRYC